MIPMQFWAKLIERQNDLRLRISQAGGILMLVCFLIAVVLEKMGESNELAWVGVLAGLCLALMGWICTAFIWKTGWRCSGLNYCSGIFIGKECVSGRETEVGGHSCLNR
jgi:UDP-N-acetylmuramyl pentapeptide phosphotransferase/UDP-N-acetylglucosamine-1-phosphate transferase